MLQDIRFAVRQMRRNPGFAVVAVITLALGIGANTAIFLLTYSILLKSLPVPHAGELVRYTFRKGESDMRLSYGLYAALRERQTATSGMFAWAGNEIKVKREGQAELVPVALTTGSLFRVLEMRPALGHGFAEQAGEKGQPLEAEALLSDDYWRTHFHADAGVVGKTLNVDNTSVTIVGVLPQGFEGIAPEEHIGLVLPLSFERVMHPKGPMVDEPGAFWLTVMGRLKPGVTLAGAQASLAAVEKQVNDEADPKHVFLSGLFGGYRLGVETGRGGASELRNRYAKPLVALEALCGLMMLLCAVNTALLILARVSGRLHEFAVRSALGAARVQLLRQVLVETALLGAGGLLLGALLGWELAHALVVMLTPVGATPVLDLRAGVGIVLFAVALSVSAAALAGLWPAWRAARTAPALDLKQAHQGGRQAGLGRWMIPTQVALGVLLIHAALLLTATFFEYVKNTAGFVTHHVTFATLRFESEDWSDQKEARKPLQIAEELGHTPGIRAAAVMSMPVMHDWFSTADYFTRDAHGNLHVNLQVWQQEVTSGYFAAVGTPVVEGRGFAQGDVGGDPVCVISRAAAKFFFPGENAVGRSMIFGDGKGESKDQQRFRIVGVVEDARLQTLTLPAPLTIYKMIEQEKVLFPYQTIAVRASSDALAANAIRREAATVLPGAPPPAIETFDQVVNENLSQQRLLSSVSGGFALLALALVATGLYGILARTVTERRREIGIRMALGARRQAIVASLARGAAVRVGIGIAAGATLAALAGRLMQSLLYGVAPSSPAMAGMTLVVLLGVLAAAFVFPAGRAASMDPMEAIREE